MQWFISSGNNLTQCIFDEYENRHRTMRKIKYGQNNKQKGRREWYNERTKTIARVLTCSGRKTKIVHNLQYYTTRKRLESNLTRILLKFRLGIVILQVLSVLLDDRCRSGNGSCFNAAIRTTCTVGRSCRGGWLHFLFGGLGLGRSVSSRLRRGDILRRNSLIDLWCGRWAPSVVLGLFEENGDQRLNGGVLLIGLRGGGEDVIGSLRNQQATVDIRSSPPWCVWRSGRWGRGQYRIAPRRGLQCWCDCDATRRRTGPCLHATCLLPFGYWRHSVSYQTGSRSSRRTGRAADPLRACSWLQTASSRSCHRADRSRCLDRCRRCPWRGIWGGAGSWSPRSRSS